MLSNRRTHFFIHIWKSNKSKNVSIEEKKNYLAIFEAIEMVFHFYFIYLFFVEKENSDGKNSIVLNDS